MEQSFNNRTSVIYQNPTHPKNYKIVKKTLGFSADV